MLNIARLLANRVEERGFRHLAIAECNMEAVRDGADAVKVPEPPSCSDSEIRDILYKELLAASVNYCYWYGASDIRPGDASASRMYTLLNSACKSWGPPVWLQFYYSLSDAGFPLMDRRYEHLHEMHNTCSDDDASSKREIFIEWVVSPFSTVLEKIQKLRSMFPGFAGDPFMKRAQLYFMQLYRIFGNAPWLRGIEELTVPADYQVPNVLRAMGVLIYGDKLAEAVDNYQLIPQGSLMEVELRAATIVACDRIAGGLTGGHHIVDVDTYLWENRKISLHPHHCTLTTDY